MEIPVVACNLVCFYYWFSRFGRSTEVSYFWQLGISNVEMMLNWEGRYNWLSCLVDPSASAMATSTIS